MENECYQIGDYQGVEMGGNFQRMREFMREVFDVIVGNGENNDGYQFDEWYCLFEFNVFKDFGKIFRILDQLV